MTAEQAKAESSQRGLEEERRSLSMQINMEREELERAKVRLTFISLDSRHKLYLDSMRLLLTSPCLSLSVSIRAHYWRSRSQ